MIKNDDGQSMVEYIMLLGVVLILVLTVLKNEKFKAIMGPDSEVLDGMRKSMVYSYRHGRPGPPIADPNDENSNDSYSGGSDSRFFVNNEPYGDVTP